jgi:hypothetical protein
LIKDIYIHGSGFLKLATKKNLDCKRQKFG